MSVTEIVIDNRAEPVRYWPTMREEKLFDVRGLAEYLGLPVQTVYKWGATRPQKGPRRIRVGRYVRFRASDVERWLDSLAEARHRAASTAEILQGRLKNAPAGRRASPASK